jgi:hypothetical protein
MRVSAVIEDEDVIRRILQHLDLWDDKRKPAPKANAPPAAELQYTIEDAIPSTEDIAVDPIYPVESYF